MLSIFPFFFSYLMSKIVITFALICVSFGGCIDDRLNKKSTFYIIQIDSNSLAVLNKTPELYYKLINVCV